MTTVQFSNSPRFARKCSAEARADAWAEHLSGEGVSREDSIAFARDLEQRLAELLRERTAARNAMRLFPFTAQVNPGAKSVSFTMYRHLGTVAWHRGNGRSIPRVDADAREETFKVRHAINAMATDPFESEASGFASSRNGLPTSLVAEKAMAAREAHEQFVNDVCWNGAPGQDLYGVKTYPWFARQFLAEPIGSTDRDAFIASLHALVNTPNRVTKEAESPDTLVVSTAAFDYMANTRLSDASDTTILEYFLRNNRWINRVEPAHELDGAGPDGEDMCFAYRNDSRHIRMEAPRIGSAFPVFRDQMELVTPYVTTTAGVMSMYPAANILGVFPVA